jgi:hypothetical protein
MDDRSHGAHDCCPHIERNERMCASRFTLNRVDQAFSVCCGSWHCCPMYARISMQIAEDEAVDVPVPVVLTVHTDGRLERLRPTGT